MTFGGTDSAASVCHSLRQCQKHAQHLKMNIRHGKEVQLGVWLKSEGWSALVVMAEGCFLPWGHRSRNQKGYMPKTMNALLFPARTRQIEVRPVR